MQGFLLLHAKPYKALFYIIYRHANLQKTYCLIIPSQNALHAYVSQSLIKVFSNTIQSM